MHHGAADLDGDGNSDIVVAYTDGPDVWLEIITVDDSIAYKRRLLTPNDYNKNGRWDGGITTFVASDLNGDGYAELLMTVFAGFDLYPRGLWCLDWKNDSLLWKQDLPGLPNPAVLARDNRGADLILVSVCSMGNAVSTPTMDDRHSYVLCLNTSGELLWSKAPAGIFSYSWAGAIDTDGDGADEVLTWTNPGVPGDSSLAPESGAFLYVFEPDGTPVDSMRFSSGVGVEGVVTGDLDSDGLDEIIISTSDGIVTVCNGQLQALNRYEFPGAIELWRCQEFLGNGKNQLIVSTDDGKTMLLGNSFDVLAQIDGNFDFHQSFLTDVDFAEPGRALLLRDDNKPRMHLLYFEKRPFLSIVGTFLVRNQRTLYGVFAVLVIALIFTNYHRRKIRRNLGVISSQRDKLEQAGNELQNTLDNLKAAQTKLVQSEKMASLGKLVAGIAHEINSPLSGIASSNNTATRMISLLRRQISQAEIEPGVVGDLLKSVEALENINISIADGSDRVDRIVRKLRSFARLDEAELQRVTLADCLDETLELLHPQMKQHVIVNRQYGELPMIPCYPGYLNQVFLNVIMNAIEAIRERGEITIRTYSDDGMAVVQVRDTGIGVESDNLERIFDPGYTTKSRGIGTGMGLAIAYQIVRDHKGEIGIESEAGRGTVVTIKLPLTLR
ncbi:MAG: hypothetical protein JSW34_00855 [Candidatus Zixiibacteriota bacterium]|nr:MAG: hypothetical protein JSW34_00855 [candidate division Zixibacteria bacterium]